MVADALQDEIKNKRKKQVIEDKSIDLFKEYLQKVDINLVERGMAFKPAKSVEYGKTDQSILNHLRNGILFLLRFNDALKKFNLNELNEKELRECMALFTLHEIHKLEFDNKLENKAENEFEIPVEAVKKFINDFKVRDFAPELTDDDYYSVAVALHKSKNSRSAARTSRFMDYEPFLYLMDNMASCTSPEEAVSSRSLKALRDGFPQNSIDKQLNLQYHKLDDIKGILTAIINKSVADIMEESGLIMLMAYENGCVYLGRGQKPEVISNEKIEIIYKKLESNIQTSTPKLSSPESLGKNLTTPRLGDYGLSDEYFFFSGAKTMLRAFIEKSIISGYADKNKKLTESMLEGINKVSKIVPLNFETSNEGLNILVGFSRAVASIHKSFIAEMISDNKQALIKTCEIWKVPDNVKSALVQEMKDNTSDLASGGKWDYSYGIAQAVIDIVIDGVKLRNTDVSKIINYIVNNIWAELNAIENWNTFISKKTEIYNKELIEYLHDTLSINGSIFHIKESSLSDVFHEYNKSGKICNLCNRGTILNKNDMKNSNSFSSFNFTNRVFVGKSKPDNIYTCIPCGVELALRKNGFETSKVSSSPLYFHLIPDYFFTPESWEIAHNILLKFSDESRTKMASLSENIFKSNIEVYESWLKNLAFIKDDETEKSSGMNMSQYMGQGYGNMIGNACIVFYKPSENTTEFHFFGTYIAVVIAAYTGMRVVVSQSPIPSIRGEDFNEMIALDSINSHVAEFYGKYIPLSALEKTLKKASALIRLGYGTSGLKDSLFPKYLRITRNEILPGSYLLKTVYRGSDEEYKDRNVKSLLDEALFIDKVIKEVKK